MFLHLQSGGLSYILESPLIRELSRAFAHHPCIGRALSFSRESWRLQVSKARHWDGSKI